MSHPSSAHVLAPLAYPCLSCHPGDYPAVLPHSVKQEGNSLRARYTHEACGNAWSCWWDPNAPTWPLHLTPEPLASLLAERIGFLAGLLDGEELEPI